MNTDGCGSGRKRRLARRRTELAACLWLPCLALATLAGCSRQQTPSAGAAAPADVPAADVPAADVPGADVPAVMAMPRMPAVARISPVGRFPQASTAEAGATSDAGGSVPLECGAEPCCGDPPQPCGAWIADQRSRNGAIVVEQVPTAECTVFVDGEAWPEGRTFRAFKFVAPGTHEVECRSSSAVLFSRTLEVALGRDTPIYWGP